MKNMNPNGIHKSEKMDKGHQRRIFELEIPAGLDIDYDDLPPMKENSNLLKCVCAKHTVIC